MDNPISYNSTYLILLTHIPAAYTFLIIPIECALKSKFSPPRPDEPDKLGPWQIPMIDTYLDVSVCLKLGYTRRMTISINRCQGSYATMMNNPGYPIHRQTQILVMN